MFIGRTVLYFVQITIFLLASFTVVNSSTAGALTDSSVALADQERRLIKSLRFVENGDLENGLLEIEQLLVKQPNFKLAQLIYADIMSAKAGPLGGFGGERSILSNNASMLLEEAKRRYQHQVESDNHSEDMVPSNILRLSTSQNHVLVVDAGNSRLHVINNEDEQGKLVKDYYATVGKNGLFKKVGGDGRTPEGVYFISSRLDPRGLADLYGDGALALNYPNEWDQILGNSGYGIWLHGVPSNSYNRAPFATEGCVALPNSDISVLYNKPNIENTPVIVASTINWISRKEANRQAKLIETFIEDWRLSSENSDVEDYKKHYSKNFNNGALKYKEWIVKREKYGSNILRENTNIIDLSLFKYPGKTDMVVATFNQLYAGDTAGPENRIRQYWRKEVDGNWRIIYEGSASYEPVHFRGIPESIMPVIADNFLGKNEFTN